MEAVIDSGGRILVPKQLRDALGLTPGSTVDISAYGPGLQIVPGGRSARLVRNKDGRLVANVPHGAPPEQLLAAIRQHLP